MVLARGKLILKKRPNKELTIEEMQIFIAQINTLIDSARKKDEPAITEMKLFGDDISITYIPDGYTDSFQPLDIAVFVVLKSIANAKLSQFLLDNPEDPIGMEKSAQVLIESWDQINKI